MTPDSGSQSHGSGPHGSGAQLEVGQRIGNYRVTRQLGQGGMGAVFEASHQYIERKAAVKVLHPDLSQNPQFATRFLNEARAVNLIKHPGLVEIFEFGILDSGTAYIIMEYLEGHSLSQRMRRTAGGLADHALGIARQIAHAMSAVHQKSIIHRDLKPDNVMLVADAERPGAVRVKVLDFGIAKLSSESDGKVRTETGAMIGTPAYMSPEQCVSDPGLDGKADVYSLGVMLYEMLAGTLPFEAKHGFDFMAAHVRMEPRPLGTLAPEVPQEVVNLVHSMLAKAPRMRPSMETVVNILDQLRAATPGLWTTGKHQLLEQPSGEIELGATMPGQSGPGLSGRSSHPSRQQLESGATVPGQSNPPSRRSKNELAVLQSDPVPRPAESAASRDSAQLPSTSSQQPQPVAVPTPVSAGVPARRSPLLPVLGLFTLAVLGVGLMRVLPSRQVVTAPPQQLAPRMVKWILKSTPSGAEVVRADGQLLGTTPWESERQPGPGETVVTLRLPGWQPKSITLSHNSGLLTELHLEPAESPAAASTAATTPPPASAPVKPIKSAKHKTARPAPSEKTNKKPDKKDDVELLD